MIDEKMKNIKRIIALISIGVVVLIPILFEFAESNVTKSIQLEYWTNVIFFIILILIMYGIFLEYKRERLEESKLEEENLKIRKREVLKHYGKVESASTIIKYFYKIILVALILVIISVLSNISGYKNFPVPYLKYYMITLLILTISLFLFYVYRQLYQIVEQKKIYNYFKKLMLNVYPKAVECNTNIVKKSGLYQKKIYENAQVISHYQYKLEDGIYMTDVMLITDKSDKYNIITNHIYHEHSVLYRYDLPTPIKFRFKILSKEIDHINKKGFIERNKYIIEGVSNLPDSFLDILDKIYRMNILDINITNNCIYIKKYIKIDSIKNKDMKYYLNCVEKYRQDIVSNLLKLKLKDKS